MNLEHKSKQKDKMGIKIKENARVESIQLFEKSEPRLTILRLEPDLPLLYSPGQSVLVGIQYANEQDNKVVTRFYTPTWTSSYDLENITPEWKEGTRLEFIVSEVENGEFTKALSRKKNGDRIFLSKPYREEITQLNLQGDENLLFISTTAGQAQNICAYDLLQKGHKGKIVSLISVENEHGLPYSKIHKMLESSFNNYQCLELLTGSQHKSDKLYIQDFLNKRGKLLSEMTRFNLQPEDCHIFLQGNPTMVFGHDLNHLSFPKRSIVDMLMEQGFLVGRNIHYESYQKMFDYLCTRVLEQDVLR